MITELTVTIRGMHCQSCVNAIRENLARLPGVITSTVEMGKAIFEFDEAKSPRATLLVAIRESGDFDIDGFSISREAE